MIKPLQMLGGTLIDVTNAEEMERLEREGRFVNTD
jgi:hypothetical protein